MKRSQALGIAAGLIVIMLSSAWLGASLALRSSARTSENTRMPPPAALWMERLARIERLPSLTPEQRERLAPILERTRTEMRSVASQAAERSTEIRRRLHSDIASVLTPAQRAEFERRWNNRPRFWERNRGGPFSPFSTNESPTPAAP